MDILGKPESTAFQTRIENIRSQLEKGSPRNPVVADFSYLLQNLTMTFGGDGDPICMTPEQLRERLSELKAFIAWVEGELSK